MRLLVVFAFVLAGCSSSPYERTQATSSSESVHRVGYRSYDPCIRCGEGWIFLNLDDTAHLKK